MSNLPQYEQLEMQIDDGVNETSSENTSGSSRSPPIKSINTNISPKKIKNRLCKILIISSIILLSLTIIVIIILFLTGVINFKSKTNSQMNIIQCKDSCCIFCSGDMLNVIQDYDFFNDSKYFVDMEMLQDPEVILNKWNKTIIQQNLTNNKDAVYKFTLKYFKYPAGSDITSCIPIDYNSSIDLPSQLKNKISDTKLQTFASNVYQLWQFLCKKLHSNVYTHPKRHSLLPLPNAQMIVAGGRFREIYYWDSYWITHGLLVSNMSISARNMVSNLMNLTATYGHMLNGNRIYYQNRSQPPLLTFMVDAIYEFEHKNNSFILNNLEYLNILKSEYYWWMNKSNKQIISINGYELNLYYIDANSPRPEGYIHDENVINHLQNDSVQNENKAYSSLRSGAESGMDYSSRWCLHRYCSNNLTNINTINVIPVELNAYLYFVELTLAKLFHITGTNAQDVYNFTVAAQKRLIAIENVLWDDIDGKWRDYDVENGQQINDDGIETISSYIPLWLLPYNKTIGIKVLTSFNESGLIYRGGVSTTNVDDNQQWDYPNAWPPMQWIMAKAAEKYNNTDIGQYLLKNITQTYINAVYIGMNITHYMHEKYNVHNVGHSGDGGFYNPQIGFGWSNGVALSFLYDFGNMLKAPKNFSL
eukprot:243072_1